MELELSKKTGFWSDDERQIMREMFADNYTETICQLLNRSYRSVCSQASLMGVKKSEAFRKMELGKQADRLKIAGAKYRFVKGQVPENKGKPMPKDVYDKCKNTMFKKGNQPHNTNYDGHERISKDGYVEVRIRKGKYALKQRVVWETLVGKIPKNHIVVFKDRNPQNLALENLELINRAENMQRNTIHRYPAELKEVIRLTNKLKRKTDATKQNK